MVKIKLFSSEVDFSDLVIKRLDSKLNSVHFTARPKDNCHPGSQQVILSISDNKTGAELQSVSFAVQVTDFAFDHISRPLLSQVTTALLGFGSLVTFVLTLLGQIDTTFGLASGTTAGALASAIYIRFLSQYQQPSVSKHP